MGTDKQNSENILHVPFVASIEQMLKRAHAWLINIPLVNYRDEKWLYNIYQTRGGYVNKGRVWIRCLLICVCYNVNFFFFYFGFSTIRDQPPLKTLVFSTRISVNHFFIYMQSMKSMNSESNINEDRGRRSRDRMVVGFTTTYAISTYHHCCCDFESR